MTNNEKCDKKTLTLEERIDAYFPEVNFDNEMVKEIVEEILEEEEKKK